MAVQRRISFYTPEYKEVHSVVISTSVAADGYYFDGFYHWISTGTGLDIIQLMHTDADTFVQVSTFSMAGFETTMSTINAITGDGVNLFIAYTYIDGTAKQRVAIVSKKGEKLHVLTGADGGTNTYNELEFVDGYLWICEATSRNIYQFSVQQNAIVKTITPLRAIGALAYDGNIFAAFQNNGTGTGYKMDLNGNLIANPANLGTAPLGASYASLDESQNALRGNPSYHGPMIMLLRVVA